MPKQKSRPRHMWSDQEKEQLIRAVEQEFSEGSPLNAAAAKMEVNPSWYRTMKKRYLAVHRHFNPLVALPPSKEIAVHQAPVETSFNSRPLAERLRLMAEYNILSDPEKESWRRRYNVTQAMIYYYRTRDQEKAATNGASSAPKELRTHAEEAAMVQEYMDLVKGQKSVFLQQHGLNHQQIYDMKARVARRQVQSQLSSEPHIPVHDLLPHQLPSPVTTTLADAIMAMEVKRDQLSGFIEDLKRMSRGQR